ncbi:hypothetical protein [Kordiimonas lipolytica]|nr:hypothetical protein [Kordiimonas lipolytica]
MIAHNSLTDFYAHARQIVLSAGYSWERDWQCQIEDGGYDETAFLREAAWVILCSGFKEAHIRKIFDCYSLAFCDWESAAEIVDAGNTCIGLACEVFRNRRKAEAIFEIAKKVDVTGFSAVRAEIDRAPLVYIEKLPMLGPITAKHLAKNLGYPIAKNDRHLVRLAEEQGFRCVDAFCEALSSMVGESIPVVDITLWRYGVLRSQNTSSFAA